MRTDRVQDLLSKLRLTEVTLLWSGKSVFFWGPVANMFNLISIFRNQRHVIYSTRISGKGVHMYKGVGVRFADFLSFP